MPVTDILTELHIYQIADQILGLHGSCCLILRNSHPAGYLVTNKARKTLEGAAKMSPSGIAVTSVISVGASYIATREYAHKRGLEMLDESSLHSP
jgi:hypothetical protein